MSYGWLVSLQVQTVLEQLEQLEQLYQHHANLVRLITQTTLPIVQLVYTSRQINLIGSGQRRGCWTCGGNEIFFLMRRSLGVYSILIYL